MPEYLAPGVYVEETSFRAKSIEGVSTSTTGFVGMASRGPVWAPDAADGAPELLTSVGDFERIYGGAADLASGPNYLAHAVRAYFDNGGARLFVSRAYQAGDGGDGRARSALLADGADDTQRVRLVARHPGSGGNGTVTITPTFAPATVGTLASAPPGSILRTGVRGTATAARLTGARAATFALPDGGRLLLTVGDAEVAVEVRGRPAEAIGGAPLADPLNLAAEARTLAVTVDGVAQRIALPEGDLTPAALVAHVNGQLTNGYARLTTADDAPAGRLAIGSDRRGSQAAVVVQANPALGFENAVTVTNAPGATNNVGDLRAVTVGELDALLAAAGAEARATSTPEGNLALVTTGTGEQARIRVREGERSQAAAFGLVPDAEDRGEGQTPLRHYVRGAGGWTDAEGGALPVADWQANGRPDVGAELVTFSVSTTDAGGQVEQYDDVGLDRAHPRWIGDVLAERPARRRDALEHAFAIEVGRNVGAHALLQALLPGGAARTIALTGGGDGVPANAAAYATALRAFEGVEDISIVAAPDGAARREAAQGVHKALDTHVERARAYRIAVLDTPAGLTPTEAMEVRSNVDSTRAALYYPWVIVPNPRARPGHAGDAAEIALPPSGFVCGVYARTDVQRGVWKAPANEVVLGALRFEVEVNHAQQGLLNPAGVNCLRSFPGRGHRVWGARTASSDPEFKYVPVRRYFNYLERSIDQGTQWVVFEPNGERLWANVRETVGSFLYNEWVSGALLGESPKEAFFVRCDRGTMTQNDLDNGRLICLVGVAVVKPAEFVVFRIGQKTADSRA